MSCGLKQKIMVTTLKSDGSKELDAILRGCIKDIKKGQCDRLKLITIESGRIKILALRAVLKISMLLIHTFLSNRWKNEEFVNIKYKKVSTGRNILSHVFRSDYGYKSKIIETIGKIKGVFIAAGIVEYLDSLEQIDYAFIDHASYINGIIYQLLSRRHEECQIYFAQYPYTIIKFKTNGNIIDDTDIITLPYNKNNAKKIKDARSWLNGQLNDPSKLLYMSNALMKKKIEKIRACDYVIYAHSFKDAQISYGFDGFVNVYDWLEFTLNNLKNKRVCVKAHPNMYVNSGAGYEEEDLKLYNELKSQFASLENVQFYDQPVPNKDFLLELDKKVILISHHGTALLEGGFNGFKCISSRMAPWKRYKFNNIWQTKEEYAKMLRMDWQELKATDIDELLNFCAQYYLSDCSYYSANSYVTKISEALGVSGFELVMKDKFYDMDAAEIEKISNLVANIIVEVEVSGSC